MIDKTREIIKKISNGNENIKSFLNMLNSCLTYGSVNYSFYNRETDSLVKYGIEYSKDIQEPKKIAKAYIDLFHKHCHILYGTYTDLEGCTYNSLDWDDYIPEIDMSFT